jgi:hypothetical protein
MVILMKKGVLVIVLIMLVVSLIPIMWFSHMPLLDYPNHLAGLQIREMIPWNVYAVRFYEFRWIFTPYLGLDLLATPFISYFPVEVAGRIVIAIAFAMIFVSTILLDRELNRDNWGLSLFAGIFLYNGAFMTGLINYIIGIGFAIISFWIWVRYRAKTSAIWVFVFTTMAQTVCLMHLYALAIYAVCVAGYECSVLWEELTIKRQVRMPLFKIPFKAAISLLLPLLSVIWLSPVASNRGPTVWVPDWDSFWHWKGAALASPILFTHYFTEKPLLLAILAIFVCALATRTVVVNSRMVIPLMAFGVIFLCMPWELLGAAGTDYRLPSGMVFFVLASIGWGQTSWARIRLVTILLSGCLIVRVGSVLLNWQPAQAIIGEYDTALRLLPPGSRLLVVAGNSGWVWVDHIPPLIHVPVLAAAKQSIFVPYTFTDDGVLVNGIQLLKLRPDYRDYWRASPESTNIDDIKRFDYLLEIQKPRVKIPSGVSLNEVGRGQTFALYRINIK